MKKRARVRSILRAKATAKNKDKSDSRRLEGCRGNATSARLIQWRR